MMIGKNRLRRLVLKDLSVKSNIVFYTGFFTGFKYSIYLVWRNILSIFWYSMLFLCFLFLLLLCPVYMVGYWQGCRLVIIAFGLILMFMSAASRPVSKNVQKWIDIFQLFYYVFENQDWTCSISYLLQDDYICKWTMQEPLIVNINH